MGPESEKRAPGAINFKKNWWRFPASAAVTLAVVVYNEENQPINTPPSNPESTNNILSVDNDFIPTWKSQLISSSVQVRTIEEKTEVLQTIQEELQSEKPAEEIPKEYTVKPGDSLSRIAEEIYGTDQLWRALAHVNNIPIPDIIYVGTQLNIPSKNEAETIMNFFPPPRISTPRPTESEILIVASVHVPVANREYSGFIQDWLTDAGWPEELLVQAKRVTFCESSHRPNAIRPNGRYFGLFQLEKNWFDYFGEDFSQWANPVVNARVGYQTYRYDTDRNQVPWTQWDPACRP